MENLEKIQFFTQKLEEKTSALTDDEQDEEKTVKEVKTSSEDGFKVGSLISSCKRMLDKE